MLSVGDSITDNILKENFENSSGLFIDESRDTLDSTSPGQTPDGGLGDSLDVITQDFAMTLCASLSESLSSFASAGHDERISHAPITSPRYVLMTDLPVIFLRANGSLLTKQPVWSTEHYKTEIYIEAQAKSGIIITK